MPKILVADDDKNIRDLLKILLVGENYEVIEAENGAQAINLVNEDVHLAILDVVMPQVDGFKACKEIRKKSTLPIIFLSAKGHEYDKLIGFSAGGDDYLVKPVVLSELVVRVKAMLRRYIEFGSGLPKQRIFRAGDLILNDETCAVTVSAQEKTLTSLEYKILLLMMKTKGKVFSAENIYESVWNEPYLNSSSNAVVAHIFRLREKIEPDPQNPQYIKTVWGRGYKIDLS